MAMLLSGGMDSAVLSKFVPKGTIAYTFRCIVPGQDFFDETLIAKRYCDFNGLEQRIVDVYWEDYEQLSPILMRNKQAPIHGFEIQLYKAALQAKSDGFDILLTGEEADDAFGGMDQLLSRDWTYGEFIKRFSTMMPFEVLKEGVVITELFKKHCKEDGFIDVHDFYNGQFKGVALDRFCNACGTAGIAYTAPYSLLKHETLDLERVRKGENKYIIRDLYKELYPTLEIQAKKTARRPMDEWLRNWQGPQRPEFWKNCHVNMSGYAKYNIWMLEKFLDEFAL